MIPAPGLASWPRSASLAQHLLSSPNLFPARTLAATVLVRFLRRSPFRHHTGSHIPTSGETTFSHLTRNNLTGGTKPRQRAPLTLGRRLQCPFLRKHGGKGGRGWGRGGLGAREGEGRGEGVKDTRCHNFTDNQNYRSQLLT